MSLAQRTRQYLAVLDFTLQGIPCLIAVSYYKRVRPWRGKIEDCPSDLDFYGYTSIDYILLDRRGYPAKWLEAKETNEDQGKIRQVVINHFEGE